MPSLKAIKPGRIDPARIAPTRAVYRLFADSPSTISTETVPSLSPQTVLLVTDVAFDPPRHFRLEAVVSRIVLYNAASLALSLHPPTRVLTSTLEMHACTNVRVELDTSLLPSAPPSAPASDGKMPPLDSQGPVATPLALLQLDPPLVGCSLHFGHPDLLVKGASVILCPRQGYISCLLPKSTGGTISLVPGEGASPDASGYTSLAVSYATTANATTAFQLTTSEGHLSTQLVNILLPASGPPRALAEGQYVVRLVESGPSDHRWSVEPLGRKENEYPALNAEIRAAPLPEENAKGGSSAQA